MLTFTRMGVEYVVALQGKMTARIAPDLDDDVKVNSGKFGDLLAEVKAVTGKK